MKSSAVLSRSTFQMGLSALPHQKMLRSIELLGTRVAPIVRKEFHTRLFTLGLRQESSIPQKRNAGKDTAESTSVETLASRQRSASASRVAWACAAYSTASLPSRRCAGR